jgi:hypothetical protein
MTKKFIYVKITGTGIFQTFKAVSHELRGLPAGSYHIFVLEDGTEVFYNDFGVRTVVLADNPEKLN